MDRRNFLRAIALTGAAFSVKQSGALTLLSQKASSAGTSLKYDLVAVMGGEPELMFRKAIAEMGGMAQFVKKGYRVVVKPNIGWDKKPEMASNTNPQLVGEIVRQCYKAGAKEVVVLDHTCNEWRNCYTNSGIEAQAKAAGAKMLPANEASYYREIDLPKGKKLKSTKVHEAILDCDVWINVPVLKNHGGAKMSIAMKNHMGIVWDRRFFHANDLQQCIADVCTLEKAAVLHVVDAYRLLKNNGPQGKSEADAVLAKGLFISQDIVAVDTAATNFFNNVRAMPLESVAHIGNAEKLNLGSTKLEKLKIKKIKL
ncbi:MAG: tat (twin-arginine translocation) pathway signal sequence [Porphyromonadaceae bacterium CG2_30_38_12]|nr:MAG: tat (twin-arginine translocation) pathway signal sequence [Porphyromonadaceae bacterium CG2_30_38_12]